MNRKEANDLLPIMEAFAKGIPIEFKGDDDTEWREIGDPLFDGDPSQYRIKPKATCVPFENAKECYESVMKHGMFLHYNNSNEIYMMVEKMFKDSCKISDIVYTYNKAFEYFKFTDGTPFGKIVMK